MSGRVEVRWKYEEVLRQADSENLICLHFSYVSAVVASIGYIELTPHRGFVASLLLILMFGKTNV